MRLIAVAAWSGIVAPRVKTSASHMGEQGFPR